MSGIGHKINQMLEIFKEQDTITGNIGRENIDTHEVFGAPLANGDFLEVVYNSMTASHIMVGTIITPDSTTNQMEPQLPEILDLYSLRTLLLDYTSVPMDEDAKIESLQLAGGM